MRVPELVDCTLVVVIGPVSSGKSWLIQQWLQKMERSITIDTTAECVSSGDFTHIWGSPQQLGERLEINPYYYRIAYHPSDDVMQDFNWCVVLSWLSERPRWLIIDEVHEVATVTSLPRRAEMLFRYARHVQLGVVASSQRLADVHKLMTDSARMVVLFHTTEPTELEAIRKRYGSEIELQIRNLRPCIYDDATKVCLQEPECLVWIRGRGVEVYALGDKIRSAELPPEPVETTAVKIETEETIKWESNSLPEGQTEPEASSLALPSGKK